MSFAIFDENYYLVNNPDVAAAVNSGAYGSGLQHFQQTGLAEGRVLVSPFYDEQLYLQANPDVAAAVAAGGLRSGLQQYIELGEAEGRSPGAFSEQFYLLSNPDVAAAVDAGTFSSGVQHYIQFGQFESNRVGAFFGTSGNDVVTITGAGNKFITGIAPDSLLGTAPTAGVGEADTLIGSAGLDVFALGLPSSPEFGTTSKQFYVGGGNADYALIQGFERLSDFVILPGSPQDYNLQTVNGSLNISTAAGDLIGTVEGVPSLMTFSSTQFTGIPINTVEPFVIIA